MNSLSQTHFRQKSKKIFESCQELIPGGVNSPVRSCSEMQMLPLVAESGFGDIVVDADGNEFIDYCCSWGPLIHGHAHPQIITAVQKRLLKGTSFGITTSIEAELAYKIQSFMPSIEKIRFVSSGTEAAMTAIRVARGYTGRSLIIKFSGNYHGHADCFLIQAGSGVAHLQEATSKGIPVEILEATICLPFNDCKAFEKLLSDTEIASDIACVIVEPIAANMGVVPARSDFLQLLRNKTCEIGALLIFDEVISGFRVAKGGAQSLYQIEPDLTVLGKIIGGGLPAAAFGGKNEIMKLLAPLGPVYQAGTLSGNPVAMQAGLESLQLLEVEKFYQDLEKKAELLILPVKEYIEKHNLCCCIQNVNSLFTLFLGRRSVNNMEDARLCDAQWFQKLFRFLFDHGVYIPPSQYEAWFLSSAHQEKNLYFTRDLLLKFLSDYKSTHSAI